MILWWGEFTQVYSADLHIMLQMRLMGHVTVMKSHEHTHTHGVISAELFH